MLPEPPVGTMTSVGLVFFWEGWSPFLRPFLREAQVKRGLLLASPNGGAHRMFLLTSLPNSIIWRPDGWFPIIGVLFGCFA